MNRVGGDVCICSRRRAVFDFDCHHVDADAMVMVLDDRRGVGRRVVVLEERVTVNCCELAMSRDSGRTLGIGYAHTPLIPRSYHAHTPLTPRSDTCM
jgi:hypothetical protein